MLWRNCYRIGETKLKSKTERNTVKYFGGKKMSYADTLFIAMCKDIIENGYSTEGEKVRPKWEDGSYAYTLKRFGIINRYDLSKEFPAITLRKTYIRSAIDEILWIWQKKSNNVHDLNSHIWD